MFTWNQGWLLTTLSSVICVCGTLVIFLDDVYALVFPKSITSKHPFKLKSNYEFLNASLAFSAGCLLFTSLFSLLPEARDYFKKGQEKEVDPDKYNHHLIFSYICGIALCLLFDFVLHLLTSESLVHHDHSHDEDHEDVEEAHESDPLMPPNTKKHSFLHYITPKVKVNVGECKGYSSAELCIYKTINSPGEDEESHPQLHYCEIPTLAKDFMPPNDSSLRSVHSDHSAHHTHQAHRAKSCHSLSSHHTQDHHHHVNSPLSRLLLVGIQTTFAITIHKLPEGFITFIMSEANPKLGFLIFISLVFHNLSEGFLMCLPLFYLFAANSKTETRAKFKALAIGAFLGGLSQPLGALTGVLFLRWNDSVDIHRLNYVFGITLAVTSGFLSVIGLSIYSTAVSFNAGSTNFVMVWCLLGMCVIAILSIVEI